MQIIKGKEKFGQKSMFSRALLTVQFFLAFTTIVGSFVLMDNCFYQNNKDWGYDHDQNYIIPFKTQTEYLTLRDKLKDHNGVISLAGSANHIGFENSRFPLVYKGERHQIIRFRVGFDYLETMNLRLSEGRFFDKSIQADNSESVIITKQFAKKMRWDHPLYQTFELDSIKRTVIGVVEDFYYDNFYNPMEPAIFTIAPEKDLHYIVLKLKATEADLIPVIKKTWEKTSPDDPFSGFFQKDVMGEFYKDNNSIVMIFSFLSGTVLIISCLGLFGLVSYNITRRLKEFSIRKIFGANGCQILNLMQRDYLWMLLISFLLGAPLGYFAANAMIHQIYPDPQEPRTVPFLIAILSMASTITLTIALQIRRVIKENPVSILKID